MDVRLLSKEVNIHIMLDGYQAVNQRGKRQIILISHQIGEIQPQSSQATYSLKFERYKEDNGYICHLLMYTFLSHKTKWL
jgi:hypothetical protein